MQDGSFQADSVLWAVYLLFDTEPPNDIASRDKTFGKLIDTLKERKKGKQKNSNSSASTVILRVTVSVGMLNVEDQRNNTGIYSKVISV